MLLRAAAALCVLLHLAAAHDDQQATTLQSLRASATNFDTATAAAPGRPWDPSAAGPCPPPGAANNDTWKGVTCDADGIVVSLSLAGLGLQGPLPPALAQLGTLRLLNLSGNGFTGSLPAAWLAPDAFANLTSADLHSNRLGAVLPDGLLSLASEVILLGSNLLNGTLPGNWQSSTLRVLGLGNNSLTGQLPSGWAMQGRLPALRELSLQANQLRGPVPAQYWTDGSFLPGLALAAEPGNPAVCGPVPPLSPELLGYNAAQLTAANVMYTGNTTTTLTVSAKDLFRPGASVTVTNWLGSCTQPCTAETLPAAVRQQGASWPPSIATNIYDLSRNYSISIADILLSNPGAATARPDGAPLQLPCYAPLSAGAQGNYRGGNVAFGMFAGGNQAEGPEGLPGAAAAGRVVGTLPNQYNTSTFYTGSLGPASNGTAGVLQLLEPVWWFVDLLAPFQVSTVVVTAGDGQELRNASLYIGSSPSSVFDNTLVAERFSVAAGKQLALAASGTAGRYVVLYTGTQQEGSMSLADVQVYTTETNAAAAKNVSLRHISTSTYQDVAPQATPAQDLLALTDNNGTTCVSLPLSPNSSWLAAALVDLGYQAPVGSVALAVGSQLPPGTTARFFVTANRGDRLQPGSPGECASEALALGSPGGWEAQECNQTGRWVAVTLSTPPSNSSDQAATVQLCEVQVSLTQSPSSEVPGSTSDSNSSSGLSAGAIAGIAVGAAAGLCLLLLLAAYLRWRHRFRGQVPEQQQEAEAAAAKGDVEMSIGDGKAFSSHSPGGGRGGGASAAVLASSDAMGDAAGSSINGGSGRLSEGMAAAAAAATSAARLAGRGQSAARHELQLMDEFVRQLVGRSTSTPLPSPAHSSGSGVPPTAAHSDEQLLGSGGRKGTDLSKLPPGFFDVKFDELQLQQQLGEGSFGKVFLATYCGTLVAVKLIEQPSGTDASGTVLPSNTVRELAKEALLMSKLRHPNVCLYLGACLEPPCLVLEYCAKKSLFALLTAGRSDPRVAKQLGWGRLLGMALDAATGMLYLHTRNPPLAHRDLKSANLLVDSHWRAKVADFNLSGAARDIGAASCSTILMNNPRWMPPEVLGGGEQGHLSADVWAFGTVLWEVMTWRLPFEGMNVFSIIALVQSKGADALAVPPPDELPAGRCACYAEYTALMRDCWAHDPSHRPGFASIVDRLRAMAASQAASGPEKPKPVAAAALAPAAVPTGPPAAAPQAWRAVSVAPPSPSDAASPYVGFVAMMRHPEQQTPFAAAQVDAQLNIMERQPGSVGTPASQPPAT